MNEKIRKAHGELMAELHRVPTMEEISVRLGWEVVKVSAVLQSVPEISSLDQPHGPEADARRLGDFVEEQESLGPDLGESLREAMRRLPERERQVLVRRYGLDRGAKATVRELSARLGISEKAVRRAQRRAEQLLKAFLEPGTHGLGEVTV